MTFLGEGASRDQESLARSGCSRKFIFLPTLLSLLFGLIASPAIAQKTSELPGDGKTAGTELAAEASFDPQEVRELGESPEDSPADPMGDSATDPFSRIEEINIVGQAQTLATEDENNSALGFSEEDLLLDGISDIRDLSTYTPNLEIKTAFAAVNPTIFIRGVGLDDFNANAASAVSVYQDGVYMYSPAGQLFGLYDVQSVNVLRGPQPTLTNASAGAILVKSRMPTDNLEAHLTSTFGTYGERSFQGALNVPIIPGRLAMRTAFQVRQRDGITKNYCAAEVNNPDLVASDVCWQASGRSQSGWVVGPNDPTNEYVNNVDNWAARTLITLKMPLPNDQEIEWLLNVNGGQNKGLAAQFQQRGLLPINRANPIPLYTTNNLGELAVDRASPPYRQERTAGNPFAGEYDRIGPELLDLLGVSLRGNWAITDSLEFETLSAYAWHDRKTYSNDDGGPTIWSNNDYTDTSWQFNQELRLDWMFGDESELSLGGSYLREDLSIYNVARDDRSGTTLPDGQIEFFSPAFSQTASQQTDQWGIYATAHLRMTGSEGTTWVNRFFVDGSIRYNHAFKSLDNVSAVLVRSPTSITPPILNPGSNRAVWTATTGDLALNYEITDEDSIYIKYSYGWKPGAFNAGTATQTTRPTSPVKPETVKSFEAGIRTQWWENRIMLNLTGFIYDYEELQVFQVTTDSSGLVYRRLINSEEADVCGVEWEFAIEPIDDLNLSLNGGYLDSAYTKFKTTFDRSFFIPGNEPPRTVLYTEVDYSGNRLIASPVWSLAGTVDYLIPLGRFGSLLPRFAYAYKTEIFFDSNEGRGAEDNLAESLVKQPAFWLLNLSLTYTTPDSRFEITGFVRNLANQAYRVQTFDISNSAHNLIDVYGDPRMAGAFITVRL